MPLGLFRLRNVATANVVGVLWAAAMFAWFFLSALYLQLVLGYSPLKVGLAFLPANLIMGALSVGVSAKLVMRFGIKPPLAAGLLLAAAGLALFARAPVDGSFVVDVLPSMILLGFGAGIAFNPVLLAAMSDVAPEESGLASGVVNTAFMMGGALGLAVLASLAASRTDTLTADGDGHLAALTGGYHAAFVVGAIFAVSAADDRRLAPAHGNLDSRRARTRAGQAIATRASPSDHRSLDGLVAGNRDLTLSCSPPRCGKLSRPGARRGLAPVAIRRAPRPRLARLAAAAIASTTPTGTAGATPARGDARRVSAELIDEGKVRHRASDYGARRASPRRSRWRATAICRRTSRSQPHYNLVHRSSARANGRSMRAGGRRRASPLWALGSGKNAVVLLSGGLDSTTVLAIAQSEGFPPYALSFRYGQRHAAELDAARRIAEAAGVVKARRRRDRPARVRRLGADGRHRRAEGPLRRGDGRRHPDHLRAGAQHDLPLLRARLGRDARRQRHLHRRQRARLQRLPRLPARSTSRPSSAWPTWPRRPASRARSG